MQLSAIAYNLKKYLKFKRKRVKGGAGMLSLYFRLKVAPLVAYKALLTYVNFPSVSRVIKLENRLKGGLDK